MAESRKDADRAFDRPLKRFEVKYPQVMDSLRKDREALRAFHDFPAEPWVHLRTPNPIESTFATVRLRTKRSRHSGSRHPPLAMGCNLLQSAQNPGKWIQGFRIERVVNNVQFRHGQQVIGHSDRVAA